MAALSIPLRKRVIALSSNGNCWMNVCIPFVVEDPAKKLHTEIILTSASFDGVEGYKDKAFGADYELYVYDFAGNAQQVDGAKKVARLSVPAMHTTLVKLSDLLTAREPFWGSMKIRAWAKGKTPTFVSDLFSAAYVRWSFADSFDTLHAHPDPPQIEEPEKYFSSMPFPSLEEYAATLCLFNPYERPSAGRIVVYGADGREAIEQPYKLAPRNSTLFDLNAGTLTTDPESLLTRATGPGGDIKKGGSIVIENDESTVKNFAYMIIRGKTGNSLSAEHTIHQGNYPIDRSSSPFGADQSFKAQGWLYSAFVFNDKNIGGLNLASRVYLSAGRPLKDEIWLLAYTNDVDGKTRWTTKDDELAFLLPSGFHNRGAVRLKPFQSCAIDFERLQLARGFAGGIGVASSVKTSHVLMKIEVRVNNWGTRAFSHFRPGSRSARALQNINSRGGLVSDYIVTGAMMKRTSSAVEADCLVGLFNMEEDHTGNPTIEAFDSNGFVARKELGKLSSLACKHIMLSDIFPEMAREGAGPLTLRLIDGNAAVIMSALHIDYRRKDVAIDHGSDRFSTFIDHPCR
jgi:hypothetical protein